MEQLQDSLDCDQPSWVTDVATLILHFEPDKKNKLKLFSKYCQWAIWPLYGPEFQIKEKGHKNALPLSSKECQWVRLICELINILIQVSITLNLKENRGSRASEIFLWESTLNPDFLKIYKHQNRLNYRNTWGCTLLNSLVPNTLFANNLLVQAFQLWKESVNTRKKQNKLNSND